ncbi:MAG: sodium:solute symporter family protein [Bacteroidetes bacterium]|nr:sodium:solute symporter family protein [Bacteroidota bacterium]
MISWILIFGSLYVAGLAYSAYISKKGQKRNFFQSYRLANSNVGFILGALTFSATLFSTFTLMGMPNFFRQHGVGAWIFLGVTDTAMAFVILWFGINLKKRLLDRTFTNVSNLLAESYNSKIAKYVYWFGIFVFLTPYVAIQIRGVASFLSQAIPYDIHLWGWALAILIAILIYSYIGGIKAIIYSDAMQGIILLFVTFFICIVCINLMGGIKSSFYTLNANNPDLLSVPGPKGLLTFQFLLTSFITIILMPITQPQLFTRIVIMKDVRNMKRMAIAVGIFAFLIIFPTIFIGAYGAINYPDLTPPEFLFNVLVVDQHKIIGALVIIGLLAAAMSTADSQLFALESEVVTSVKNQIRHKIPILIFAGISFLIATSSSFGDNLVLLARLSFMGTALLAPMILFGIFSKNPPGKELPIITGLTLLIYLISCLWPGLVSAKIMGINLVLLLLAINILVALIRYTLTKLINI